MPLIRYRPRALLDRLIDCFWWSQREVPQEFSEHMLPSGAAHLVFALHDEPLLCGSGASQLRWCGGLVHGPQGRYYVAGPKPCGAAAGVAFRPGAAGAVLGVPLHELTDRHVPLEALWGARGRRIEERLRCSAAPQTLFALLERELRAGLRSTLLMHPAIAQSLRTAPSARIEPLRRESGYSPRHYIALFRASVGLTPKRYFRIERFNRTLRHLAATPRPGLADLAAALGYADQTHLTREFHELAGTTPTRYRPTASPGHHRAEPPGLK